MQEAIKRLEALYDKESEEIAGFFRERGMPTLEEEELGGDWSDEENCIYEDGILTGIRKAITALSKK